jgi:hypothetical protein
MKGSRRRSRLEVLDADHGRDFGWFVEKDGQRVALLTNPRFVDMFWYSYTVEPTGATDAERAPVYTKEFWNQAGMTFRNRETGEIAPNAFPGGLTPTREQPLVLMRALHIGRPPGLIERAMLWIRRRRRR